jgi:protein gp37
MADNTGIEWTDATWSPVTGCTAISAGCDHCYAEVLANRLRRMGVAKYANGFDVTLHPDTLALPLTWKRPRRIFVNSMSDLFHARVPFAFVERVWRVMLLANHHTYQILTKRPERMARFTSMHPAPTHIWLGTSVEDQRVVSRIDHLRACNAQIRFLSIEPLIGPLPNLELDGIHWVIVGGESGAGCRQLNVAWVRDVRDQCREANVAFFFKQWGGFTPKKGGRLLDGRTWDDMPDTRRISMLSRQLELDDVMAR